MQLLTREGKALNLNKRFLLVTCLALSLPAVVFSQQGPPPGPPGGGRAGAPRFKIYPQDAIQRGSTEYDKTCGYCHGLRAKGGQAGPDLIVSVVTLHDEDGIGIGQFLKGEQHQKDVKLDLPPDEVHDIAAYLHSRVIFASGRGNIHMDEVLVGDPKAGEIYFNGAGRCNTCHSPTGDLKGIGAKYDPATLQNKLVMPRAGRGGFGAAAGTPEMAVKGTVTLPSGQAVTGELVRLTDFDVVIRMEDGTTKTYSRDHGIPKVVTTDPLQAHLDLMTRLKDSDMHNLTAYLATLK